MSISGGAKELIPALYMCANERYAHIEDASPLMRGRLTDLPLIGPENLIASGANPYKELFESTEALAAAGNIAAAQNIRRPPGGISDIECEFGLNIGETLHVIKSLAEKIKRQNEELGRANSTIRENTKIMEQLEHIGVLTEFGEFFRFEFFKCRFGHMPRDAYDSITVYGMADMDDAVFVPSRIDKHEVWGLYFAPNAKSRKVDSALALLHFESVKLPEKVRGSPESMKSELIKETEEMRAKAAELKSELEKIISEAAKIIEEDYEKIYTLFKIYELKKKTVMSNSSFHLAAWVPEDHVDEFSRRLSQLSTVVAPVDSPEDVPSMKPPTLLKNIAPFRPFEQFVAMYGLPSYNEIDPTPLLAVTYILCFGIMFGDLGQGLVISAVGLLIWRLKRINLGRIMAILGLSSAFFGCIFGSVFGFEDIIGGYNPLDHINSVLIAAVVMGMLIVSCAIIINILNGVKQKNAEKILFSQNGIAGLIFYWSVIAAGAVMLNFLPLGISAAVFISVAVICGAVIYLREPLANMLERKSKIIPGNPAEFFTVNLFELFEIVLSFLTNTISFIRVGAFALNHVGMMSVVLLLSGAASGNTNIFVIIIGNVIVIALEGLIVGIQCLRLQYYEIFGRFFEGNGQSFEPGGLSAGAAIDRPKNYQNYRK